MNRIRTATAAWLVASFVALQPVAAFADDQQHRSRYEDQRDRRDDRRDRREDRRNGWDDDNGRWDAARYYRRDNRRYAPRRLSRRDRIYRGSDNRYYCRRDDGTTGLIVGGIAGGVLGNIVARDHSRALGTIVGAGAGAALGHAIDSGDVVCR